jgi:hypothetical protein
VLDPAKPLLLVGDGANHSHPLRKALHDLGVVEQIHAVSHGDNEKSRRNARKHNKMRLVIDGYPNWLANGHNELFCSCGQGQTWKEIGVRHGKAVIRTSGRCPNCGPISITTGTWRKVKNVGRKGQSGFVRCQPGEADLADQAFGNPLTYNDQMAEVYGCKRFGHNEGLHGQLTTRYNLLKGKRWFRRRSQARTDVAVVFSIIHCLAMKQRRLARRRAAGGGGPPPAQARAA